jgi:hypothetical protein
MLDRRAVSMTRTLMQIRLSSTTLAALVAGLVLSATVAWATVAGVVTEVTKRDITVSGAVYKIEDGIEVQDMTGHPITWPEIRPGVAVELDFDDEGNLSVIRAAVVR